MEGGGRESPGVRVPFFRVAERKEPKKGRPHCLRPLRFATGQPAVLGFGGVSLELAPFHFAQTIASPDPPNPALLGASRGARGHNIHTGLCFARPHLAGASATRCATWAERSDGPNGCSAVRLFGCSAVHPLLAAPAAGRLRGEHGRRSAHASCSDSPWLSERRAQRKASSTAHPATDSTQVCPFAPRRGRRLGVAFSLVTFFWRSKRKLLARRATPGPRPKTKHASPTSAPRLRRTQPERITKTQSLSNK